MYKKTIFHYPYCIPEIKQSFLLSFQIRDFIESQTAALEAVKKKRWDTERRKLFLLPEINVSPKLYNLHTNTLAEHV